MFASIGCMHWSWKNCPMAWQGQIQDKNKTRNIILETIVNQSLRIWHTFFGLPKGNNDVNVLHKSSFVAKLLRGEEVGFMMNGMFYPCYYLLVDGIYALGVLCKPYMNPKTKSSSILPKCKKEHEKMLKGHSVVQNPC